MDLNSIIEIVEIDGNHKSAVKNKIRILRSTPVTSTTTTTATSASTLALAAATQSESQKSQPQNQPADQQEEISIENSTILQEIHHMDIEMNEIEPRNLNEAVIVTTEVTTMTTTPVVSENGLILESDKNNGGGDGDDDGGTIDQEKILGDSNISNPDLNPLEPLPTPVDTETEETNEIVLGLVDEDDSKEEDGSQIKVQNNQSDSGFEFSKSDSSSGKASVGHVIAPEGNVVEENENQEDANPIHIEPSDLISESEAAALCEGNEKLLPKATLDAEEEEREEAEGERDRDRDLDLEDEDPDDPVNELEEENGTETGNVTSMWNQNNCIVCNVAMETPAPNNSAPSQKEGNSKLKKFFFEYLGVNETMDFGNDSSFPFCQSCNDDLDKLMALACKIEFMDLQFEKLRDTLARKTVKTYLVRTRPEILEENAEPVVDVGDEPLEAYSPKPMVTPADLLFNQWKRQYDMIIPGRYKKYPALMKTVDPKQRVSYYRLDASGKHHFITTINPEVRVTTEQSATPVANATTPSANNKALLRGSKRSYSSVAKINPGDMANMKRVKMSLEDSLNRSEEDTFEDGSISMALGDGSSSGEADQMLNLEGEELSEDKIFKCVHCPKSFSSRSILNYHSRVHSGERPFKCNLCEKSFAQRGGLATHALVHSGEKPYNCEECGKSFRQKYHLTQHQLIHSGLKPFSCEICHKSFNVKMNLREHMRRHTGERPYRCTYCPCQGFFRKKMLRDHIVKSHPENPLPPDLVTLGPTPKFPKQKSGSNSNSLKTMEDMQQMFNEEDNENEPHPGEQREREKRILIKTEGEVAEIQSLSNDNDENEQEIENELENDTEMDAETEHDHQEELLGLQNSATLISINLSEANDNSNELGAILEEQDQSSQEATDHHPNEIERTMQGQGQGPPEPILSTDKTDVEEVSEVDEVQMNEASADTDPDHDHDQEDHHHHLEMSQSSDSGLLLGDNITVTTVTVDEAIELDGMVTSNSS